MGCATTGDEDNGNNMYVICDGQVFNEGFALLLFFGDVCPRFYVGNYLEEFLLEASAEVTEASGVVVHKLNGQPTATYLARCGIEMTDESRPGLITIPILHKRPGEDALVARTMVDFDETGSATFFAEIPVGSTFRMAACGADDILESTRAAARRAVEENPDAGLMLLFSCIGRYISLGLGAGSELECATDLIAEGVPYLASYVSGEICPVTSGDRLVNRYHNSSFIICTLK